MGATERPTKQGAFQTFLLNFTCSRSLPDQLFPYSVWVAWYQNLQRITDTLRRGGFGSWRGASRPSRRIPDGIRPSAVQADALGRREPPPAPFGSPGRSGAKHSSNVGTATLPWPPRVMGGRKPSLIGPNNDVFIVHIFYSSYFCRSCRWPMSIPVTPC